MDTQTNGFFFLIFLERKIEIEWRRKGREGMDWIPGAAGGRRVLMPDGRDGRHSLSYIHIQIHINISRYREKRTKMKRSGTTTRGVCSFIYWNGDA